MAIFKCKMCGGDLTVEDNASVCECEYCGTRQTVANVEDEKLQTLFNRANTLRMKSEFDKAEEIYEKIIQADDKLAEAYWGLILCRYGIEYVEDPETYKRVPTCHRASYDPVVSDEDYKNALQYADATQRQVYEQQAAEIDEIQKGIIAISQNEDPYDVFICYKETDENGKRTVDSTIANDIYYQLTQEGFKVFYAAITLEDKLGKEYEPYIFSALNSAKVMLTIGTKPEYFNAVWVKNEWSRFLKIMKKDRSKLLIPCYRDMDAYELPEEFAHLQAQDMSKIGFINDVVRGIKKVIVKEEVAPVKETVVVQQTSANSNVVALIKRGNMALEDEEWKKADEFFEDALNQDPECADCYVGKLLAREECKSIEEYFEYKISDIELEMQELEACSEDTAHIEEMVQKYVIPIYLKPEEIKAVYKYNRDYKSTVTSAEEIRSEILEEIEEEKFIIRAKQYASSELQAEFDAEIDKMNKALDKLVEDSKIQANQNKENVVKAYADFITEADKKAQELYDKACDKQEKDYQARIARIDKAESIPACEELIKEFSTNASYKDSKKYIGICEEKIAKIKQKEEEDRQAAYREAERQAKVKKKKIIIGVSAAVLSVVAIIIAVIVGKSIIRTQNLSELVANVDSIKVGDTIDFGSYEWRVLGKNGKQLLIISKDAVTEKRYNDTKVDITWEKCTLRKWLNNDFYNSSFNSAEQSRIITTNVSADNNPKSSISPGNATQDKVFLLSITEVNMYFTSDSDRVCKFSGGSCWWWLRSPGIDSYRAADVESDGSVRYGGHSVIDVDRAVRPALWINLES